MRRKRTNQELVDFAVKAREMNMTYGQLQVLETIEKQKAAAAKKKAGGEDD